MMVSIINPVFETYIFIAILVVAILLSVRKKKDDTFFPLSTTNELKGLAILTVIFGHIGYFLVTGNLFLFPISTLSGVGVDLFLFLSGYGLTVSAMKKSRTIGNFYKDRLSKLLVPFWLVLGLFFILDFFVLNKAYPVSYTISSFLGFFSSADLYNDINSPLWYFTFILFYYLIFPLVFSKKRPWLSAAIIYLITYVILAFNFSFISGVNYFYETHYWAFPIGILLGGLLCEAQGLKLFISNAITKIDTNKFLSVLRKIGYGVLILVLLFIIVYASYSGVGRAYNIEQLISIIMTLAFVSIFLLKNFEIKLFSLFGLYSYEIYLLHWPILYRYDFIFKFLPGWLALVVYLILFICLGWLLKKASDVILNKVLRIK